MGEISLFFFAIEGSGFVVRDLATDGGSPAKLIKRPFFHLQINSSSKTWHGSVADRRHGVAHRVAAASRAEETEQFVLPEFGAIG